MQNKKIILFYKNISSVGGAEVLLCRHYNYLIDLGFDVKIVCFKFSEIDRLNINKEDIEDIKSSSFIFSMVRLIKILLKIKINSKIFTQKSRKLFSYFYSILSYQCVEINL